MREIGGYLDYHSFDELEYHRNAISLNTGRNALVYLWKTGKYNKIFLPSFLCDSVFDVCERENIAYESYKINKNLLPEFDRDLKEKEVLYVVNYYGLHENLVLEELKTKYKNIIVDNVQAFFQKPLENVDTLYSCRKFFGVPDGAYLYTDKEIKANLIHDKSAKRMTHILGRYEEENANQYYRDFKLNDASFKKLPLMKMSKLTHNLMRSFDYEKIRSKREKNYMRLDDKLHSINKFHVDMPIGPYCYPLYIDNGNTMREKLIANKIYVPILWPNVINSNNQIDIDFAENILPIPCDQRYDEVDMDYISDIVKRYNREGII